MSVMNRIAVCIAGAAMVLALSACGNQSTSTTSSGAASQSASTANAMPAPTALKITSWGPESTKAGVAFNVQPNGGAAFWVRLNQSMEGFNAFIDFNGTSLQGAISGNLMTAAVPAGLYARPGTFTLYVTANKGERTLRSNDVKFVVE